MRTLVQQRGPITDYMGLGPDNGLGGAALCVCQHGKQWPEGDSFEPEGSACRECCLKADRSDQA
jgi:hypothetical protein